MYNEIIISIGGTLVHNLSHAAFFLFWIYSEYIQTQKENLKYWFSDMPTDCRVPVQAAPHAGHAAVSPHLPADPEPILLPAGGWWLGPGGGAGRGHRIQDQRCISGVVVIVSRSFTAYLISFVFGCESSPNKS